MAEYRKPGNYQGRAYLGQGKPGSAGDLICGAIYEGNKPPRWMTAEEYAQFKVEAPQRSRSLLSSIKEIVRGHFGSTTNG